MTIATETGPSSRRASLERQLTTWLVLDAEKIAYAVILVLAVATRFWDLGVRVMSHDESLHTRFSWDLYRGNGYAHTPLMHGPLLFHMTALSYFLFGDNDFTSRIYPALTGVLLVMFPLLMRRWLGKFGALAASVMFLISPLILYYSRYIRHDIPSILFAMIIAYAAWRYIEKPEFKWLPWIGAGMALMFASKEVAFIYVAIFGSFLTIYLVTRHLLDVSQWAKPELYTAFVATLTGVLLVVVALGATPLLIQHGERLLESVETAEPADPLASPTEGEEESAADNLLDSPLAIEVAIGVGLLAIAGALALADRNMRRGLKTFPVFDVLMVLGTLVLPLLAPFAIKAAGFDPMDETVEGIRTSWLFTGPVLLFSVALGLAWGAPPKTAGEEEDFGDWAERVLLNNRWWVIGGVYYALFMFFFTTMFTNGNGLGTGVVGSLGYWLAQQGVRRGSQPDYYYALVMVPIYEFLPLLLTVAAGGVGAVLGLRKLGSPAGEVEEDKESEAGEAREVRFPVLLFAGYWAILNFAAYSMAGEKMPWLTTHLTTPMILIGGWLVGKLLAGIQWRTLRERNGWWVFAFVPLATVALIRVLSPIAAGQALFVSQTQTDLAATGLWLTALLVLVGALIALMRASAQLGARQTARLTALLAVGALTFQTARAAWLATYINYDDATEYLVYAHSAASVKIVMEQIEEISLRTTDSYDLKVAYDNRVSWPFSWYLRDYEQAIFYGDQPTRSQLSQAPVILAGPDNWGKVEPLIGDRYYKFEYIRMWWPMQDYFDMTWERVGNGLLQPELRHGLWQIFLQRDYDAYGEATGKNFALNNWPVAERMRYYVRKDVFAQMWDYGVAATELAEATDPYAERHLDVAPILTIGEPGQGPDQLDAPRGMAIGPDELLYVADSKNHRVQVFTLDGEHVRSIWQGGQSAAAGGFNEPWGVAVDGDGNLYVADTWNHRVQKFDAQGEFVTEWGVFGQSDAPYELWGPRDVAVSATGEVFVTDTGNKRIRVYTTDGDLVRQIGTPGGLDGQLDEPVGIVVNGDGEILVADSWNQRVQVFNPVGVYLRQWFVSAWYGQSLENKPYLDVDDAGNVYLTDPEGFRVLVFDAKGQFVTSFGDFESFNLASGIAVDGEGNLYVSDGLAGKVYQFAPVVPLGAVNGDQNEGEAG